MCQSFIVLIAQSITLSNGGLSVQPMNEAVREPVSKSVRQSTRNQLTAANSNNIIHYFKLVARMLNVSQHCIDYSRVCTCVTCSEQWLVRCDTPQAPPCEPGAVGIRGSRPEATHSPSNRGIENDTPRDFRRPVNSKETIQKGRFITKR